MINILRTGDIYQALMSALGQKRTCAVHWAMSALPPKADIQDCQRIVR